MSVRKALLLEGASSFGFCPTLTRVRACMVTAEFEIQETSPSPNDLPALARLVPDLVVVHCPKEGRSPMVAWTLGQFSRSYVLVLQCGSGKAIPPIIQPPGFDALRCRVFRCASATIGQEIAAFLDERNLTASPPQVLPRVIGASPCLRAAADQVLSIAESDATCLLLGETGTGKELFARAIHYLGPHKHKPFIPVNCGAIPDALFENEIFGHTRGAYTDARSPEIGLLSYAENGTLFLDEVETLSPSAQIKLLRVLQEAEYRPIGSARTYHTDARIVAATNCDLRQLVAERRFREDLYHRLNVLRLTIPPLRERREDIPLLARHFLLEFAKRHRRGVRGIEEVAARHLMNYDWPGNVRELQSVLQRAVLLARSALLTTADLDLPSSPDAHPWGRTLKEGKELVIREFERKYLANVLQQCHGNISRAAKIAGKERRSFQRLLRKHCIAVSAYRLT